MLLRKNPVDDTTLEFAHTGWWILHAIAISLLIFLGYLAKDKITE